MLNVMGSNVSEITYVKTESLMVQDQGLIFKWIWGRVKKTEIWRKPDHVFLLIAWTSRPTAEDLRLTSTDRPIKMPLLPTGCDYVCRLLAPLVFTLWSMCKLICNDGHFVNINSLQKMLNKRKSKVLLWMTSPPVLLPQRQRQPWVSVCTWSLRQSKERVFRLSLSASILVMDAHICGSTDGVLTQCLQKV